MNRCGPFLTFFLFLLFFFGGKAQSIIRTPGEDKDALINRINQLIKKPLYRTGSSLELEDSTATYILYFEIKALKPIPKKTSVIEPFNGVPTVTLFNVLYSNDGILFTKHVVDTLDENSGCCPCHQPDFVDSVFHQVSQSHLETIVTVTHPVKWDCSSITSHTAYLYEDLDQRFSKGTFWTRPSYQVGYTPQKKNNRKVLWKAFQKKKKEN